MNRITKDNKGQHIATKCVLRNKKSVANDSFSLMAYHLVGTLKISDFGLATVFRHGGRSRPLETPCGSAPYVAPEVCGG